MNSTERSIIEKARKALEGKKPGVPYAVGLLDALLESSVDEPRHTGPDSNIPIPESPPPRNKKERKKYTRRVAAPKKEGNVKHDCCGSNGPRHKKGCPNNMGGSLNRGEPKEPVTTGKLMECIECSHKFRSTLDAYDAKCPNCEGRVIEK